MINVVQTQGFATMYYVYKYPALNVLSELSPLLPAFSLSVLFFSSTLFTESITLSKYPRAYKAYQQRVGMFGPSIRKYLWARTFGNAETERLVWGSVKAKEL